MHIAVSFTQGERGFAHSAVARHVSRQQVGPFQSSPPLLSISQESLSFVVYCSLTRILDILPIFLVVGRRLNTVPFTMYWLEVEVCSVSILFLVLKSILLKKIYEHYGTIWNYRTYFTVRVQWVWINLCTHKHHQSSPLPPKVLIPCCRQPCNHSSDTRSTDQCVWPEFHTLVIM